MKLYGLFDYAYDYHEWEVCECVSHNRGKLEGEIGDFDILAGTWEEHQTLARKEKQHYYIKEVKVI
jgi:hypothetical protein